MHNSHPGFHYGKITKKQQQHHQHQKDSLQYLVLSTIFIFFLLNPQQKVSQINYWSHNNTSLNWLPKTGLSRIFSRRMCSQSLKRRPHPRSPWPCHTLLRLRISAFILPTVNACSFRWVGRRPRKTMQTPGSLWTQSLQTSTPLSSCRQKCRLSETASGSPPWRLWGLWAMESWTAVCLRAGHGGETNHDNNGYLERLTCTIMGT